MIVVCGPRLLRSVNSYSLGAIRQLFNWAVYGTGRCIVNHFY